MQSYYDGINQGEYYLCDRCNIVKLREDEYNNNVRYSNNTRFCDECTNYIILKKFKCNECGMKGTMRSERLLPKICCGQEVSWLR